MFYQTGPFAILPMNGPDGSGTRSAIVLTVARDLAPAVTALPARALAAEIEKRMGGLLGEVRMAAPAWSYPLGFPHAARLVTERPALVGDAALGTHPIAGPGLTLGVRDVPALKEVFAAGQRLERACGEPQRQGPL